MNVDSLKSELQQVLENDVALRKEFNELKRSLSDYRNQLIMRDEDCKRLQVTIDVLNTKLVVMERDNNNYKAELSSFKELRGTIKEQLQAKQEEIDARLEEIHSLRNDLNTLAASYEQQINEITAANEAEVSGLKQSYEAQINELRSGAHYKENGIRAEYENRLSELNNGWSEREHHLLENHEQEINSLREAHRRETEDLTLHYNTQLESLSAAGSLETTELRQRYENAVNQAEETIALRVHELSTTHEAEVTAMRRSFESEKQALIDGYEATISQMKSDSTSREAELVGNYEGQIAALRVQLESSTNGLTSGFNQQIAELREAHEQLLAETLAGHEERVSAIVNEYEEKLSFTLIHSNSQNSKLNDELARYQSENESSLEKIRELTERVNAGQENSMDLAAKLAEAELSLASEASRYLALAEEFEQFRHNAALSNTDQVNDLNAQIAHLNQAHSEYVNELNSTIEGLRTEVQNITTVFEGMTNHLAEVEGNLDARTSELGAAVSRIGDLELSLSEDTRKLTEEHSLVRAEFQAALREKELAFEKLLAENAQLISEIEETQRHTETREQELNILRAEAEELKTRNAELVQDFKDTISEKNFRITNLEAGAAALRLEVQQLKDENTGINASLRERDEERTAFAALESAFSGLKAEKEAVEAELSGYRETITGLNSEIEALARTVAVHEEEIADLRSAPAAEEQEAFISKLFKQIDVLNDERLSLLNEKEQMATQLLKMNEVVGSLSQRVDNENIDVTDLNNHRKNVILASNSAPAGERSAMKKQINELVREIDKCISLLSA